MQLFYSVQCGISAFIIIYHKDDFWMNELFTEWINLKKMDFYLLWKFRYKIQYKILTHGNNCDAWNKTINKLCFLDCYINRNEWHFIVFLCEFIYTKNVCVYCRNVPNRNHLVLSIFLNQYWPLCVFCFLRIKGLCS